MIVATADTVGYICYSHIAYKQWGHCTHAAFLTLSMLQLNSQQI